jgi:CDP-paratose 2-epimerase
MADRDETKERSSFMKEERIYDDRNVIRDERPVLITGGAGFIGTNLADRILSSGQSVIIFDNLSRAGVKHNLHWLLERHGGRFLSVIDDVRDGTALYEQVRKASAVFHLAAQVAVTTSMSYPRKDYEVNMGGTINLLESLRHLESPPPVLFTSTNKVYGCLDGDGLRRGAQRYEQTGLRGETGFDESQPLNFCSPYGCSKGAADQYVLDYARMFKIPAVVFRMSCIYGPHQFGFEDQGWVAHILIRMLKNEDITLYGDGFQVRDILFVGDLVEALLLAIQHIRKTTGEAFNMGGGPANTISLLELLELLGKLDGRKPQIRFADWRLGDQKYYVSNTAKFRERTGWAPKVGVQEGVKILYDWLKEHHPDLINPSGFRRSQPARPRIINREEPCIQKAAC